MEARSISKAAFAMAAALLIGGCATYADERRAADENTRLLEAEIVDTMSTVKASGTHQVVRSNAIRLPMQTLHPITIYAYQYPASCGSHFFRVLESGETEILEYSHLRPEDGTVFVIRDYVRGPSPFIEPGLWTSYDHTAMDIPDMMARLAKTSSAVTPHTYSQGLVTGLATMTQQELDVAYRSALKTASECPAVHHG